MAVLALEGCYRELVLSCLWNEGRNSSLASDCEIACFGLGLGVYFGRSQLQIVRAGSRSWTAWGRRMQVRGVGHSALDAGLSISVVVSMCDGRVARRRAFDTMPTWGCA